MAVGCAIVSGLVGRNRIVSVTTGAEMVYRFALDRCVRFGAPGMGKTTIAVALTLDTHRVGTAAR